MDDLCLLMVRVSTPRRQYYTPDDVTDLVRQVLDAVKAETGWTQEEIAADLAEDGRGRVTQAAISMAKHRSGASYIALQSRILERYTGKTLSPYFKLDAE